MDTKESHRAALLARFVSEITTRAAHPSAKFAVASVDVCGETQVIIGGIAQPEELALATARIILSIAKGFDLTVEEVVGAVVLFAGALKSDSIRPVVHEVTRFVDSADVDGRQH